MSKSYEIAVIPGDGTGPEVVREGIKVLKAAASEYGAQFNFKYFGFGGEHYKETGEILPNKDKTPADIDYVVISDIEAITQGGLGVAAGGNINPEGVSMFESIGGSAPKYTGQNVINPIASIGAVAMMADHLGEETLAKAIDNAVAATTPKLKSLSAGKMGYSTSEVGDLVSEAVRTGF